MKVPNHLQSLAVCFLLGFSHPGLAQGLTPTSAPADNWAALASSADGSTVVAAASYGWIYVSTNSGSTWNPASTTQSNVEPERPWTALACSADGKIIAAVANFAPVFVSTNGGLNWWQTGTTGVWTAVAISSDGSRVIAADNAGAISISSDYGRTWSASGAPVRQWRSLTCSGNGAVLFAGSDVGTNYIEPAAIYTSTNAGATWIATSAPSQPWQTLSCSADGTRVAAGAYGGMVYLSSDSGGSWKVASVPNRRWAGVAGSSDGRRLLAAAEEGDVYFSGNFGQTWTQLAAPASAWLPVASSADGIHIFLGIYDAANGGIYEAQLPPELQITPSTNGTIVSWPAPAAGYTLQQNANIASASWKPVSAKTTVVNGANQVLVPATSGVSAYRLVRSDALRSLGGPIAAQEFR